MKRAVRALEHLSGVLLFSESDLATPQAFVNRLRSHHRPAEPAAGESAANGQNGRRAENIVAAVVSSKDRLQAISMVKELIGKWSTPPPVLLVIDEITAGEYDALVNHGPVRYVCATSDSEDLILSGLLATARYG